MTFIVKRKPNWLVLIVTGIWSLGWLTLMLTLLYGLISDPDKFDGELFLFVSLFAVIGLLVLKIFLWHLRGKENIHLTDSELIIEKKGTFLSFPRKYEIDNIEYISNTEKSTIPKWMEFWGLRGGNIEFVYLGNTKYFGQTISMSQAAEIIKAIKIKIE